MKRMLAVGVSIIVGTVASADPGALGAGVSLAPAHPGSTTAAGAQRGRESLVSRQVPPAETDPDIQDQWLEDHYVWFNPDARGRDTLFVFMTGANTATAATLIVPRESPRLGYHAIALTYPNSWNIGSICAGDPDPTCQERVRLEIIDGSDRSERITVTPPHSIDNRLTKLLLYLDAHHPREQWRKFLDRGEPRWKKILVGGWSFGGMQAAMIARLRETDGVLMLAGTADGSMGMPGHWVAPGETPPERHYVLSHLRDPIHSQGLANWTALGLLAFGEPVVVESSAPPYDGAHILVTDLLPATGSYAQAHGSVARDVFTPRASDGTPLLLDAWRHMLTVR